MNTKELAERLFGMMWNETCNNATDEEVLKRIEALLNKERPENAKEEGRLSAFKEMRDWAKKELDLQLDILSNVDVLNENCGVEVNISLEQGKELAFIKIKEFAEAKMKGE